MRKALLVSSSLVGILEIIRAGLWCLAGAGLYGSPLVGMSGADLGKVVVYLLVGLLLVLPACILSRWWPKSAGLLLVVAGLLSGAWHVGHAPRLGSGQEAASRKTIIHIISPGAD